ncbi:MAG: WbqC family protein [Thermodesulfobacteriota bacterium]
MRRISIIQPSFLPWLGYFEQMGRADVFVHFDDVQYTRKDWRNRNRLKSPDGVQMVTVPVQQHHYAQTPINQIRISYDSPWNEKMLHRISFWYKSAPYFEPVFSEIKAVLMMRFDYLTDLNYALLEILRKRLEIATPQYKSSDLPGKPEDKNAKIIDICRRHNADLLYDGNAAKSFINRDLFAANGISVIFQEYHHTPYPQLWGDFTSHLSVLDLLMNCGPESRKILLSSPVPELLEKPS